MSAVTPTRPGGHVDITSPACGLFTVRDFQICKDVVLLHADATPLQLLGFAHGRCREMCILANLASCSNEGEGELKQVAEHLWSGLETVLATLDAMSSRMGEKS